MSDNHDLLNDNDMCSFPEHEAEDMCFNCGNHTCGDGLPSVEKSPINQRFLRFRQKKGCVFLVPQSDDISGGLPQGIGFGEREIYILAKGYFFAKVVSHHEV